MLLYAKLFSIFSRTYISSEEGYYLFGVQLYMFSFRTVSDTPSRYAINIY